MTNWSYCGLEKLSVQTFKFCQKRCGYITHQPSNMSSSEALEDKTNMDTNTETIQNTITVTNVSKQRWLWKQQAMIIKMFRKLSKMRHDVPPSAIWEINKCYLEPKYRLPCIQPYRLYICMIHLVNDIYTSAKSTECQYRECNVPTLLCKCKL